MSEPISCACSLTTVLQMQALTTLLQFGQGPAGPAGDDMILVAATDLSGHRVIALDASGSAGYASCTDPSALMIVGLTKGAVLAEGSFAPATRGSIAWPSAAWVADLPLYLALDGLLTQTPPTTGWLRQIGIALAPDLVLVQLGPAIYLGDE